MKRKKALIAGATGLVGNELLHILLDAEEYEQVTVLVRRPLNLKHSKLVEVVVDYDHLDKYADVMEVDDVFSCLGTTIKKAKTQDSMYKVDVEYPLMLAQLAYKNQAKHFLLISSMNANPDSKIWYSKMKGELEKELSKIPFEKTSILRPALLLGERNEFRLGEKVASVIFKGLSFLFVGPLLKVKAIEGKQVAKSMCIIAQRKSLGIKIYSSDQLQLKGKK